MRDDQRIAIATALLLAAGTAAAAESRLTGDLPRKDDKPLEDLPGLETEYGSVRTSEGVRLRTIVTRPAGTTKKLPAIFHTQAVSCGSIEPLPADRLTVLGGLAQKSGMALIRVERAGTGDSEGPACDKLDYDTEVRHYREALDQLARHKWVDGDRIVIYGSSLGSTTAPLVAQGRKVAGVVVHGGGAATYLERMINFDRLYVERSGKYRPEQIHDEMIRRIAFQQLYLIGKKTPEQIAKRAARPRRRVAIDPRRRRGPAPLRPALCLALAGGGQEFPRRLGEDRGAGDGRLFLASTSSSRAPRTRSSSMSSTSCAPAAAKLVPLNGYDHSVWRYPDEYAAYREEGGTRAPEALLDPILAWLKDNKLSGE